MDAMLRSEYENICYKLKSSVKQDSSISYYMPNMGDLYTSDVRYVVCITTWGEKDIFQTMMFINYSYATHNIISGV